MNGIGERIKFIRKSRNITQVNFAKTLGITQAYVSRLEKGTENPSELLLNFISFRYSVSLEWLKTGNGEFEISLGWEHEDITNTLHSYAYKLEEIYKYIDDDSSILSNNSLWYFYQNVKLISESTFLSIFQKRDLFEKLDSIYRLLWGICSSLSNISEKNKNDAGILLKINTASSEIQKIVNSMYSIVSEKANDYTTF